MPHLIDKETGLCVVCNRLEIAAIKEGKKYKRQVYDVRKLAIDKLTSKNDPNYRAITDRHYVKYKDTLEDTKDAHKQAFYNQFSPRPTFTKKLPIDNKLTNEDLSDEEELNYKNDSILENRSKSRNEIRETLRKVNLAQVSRLNKNFRTSEPNIVYVIKKPVKKQQIKEIFIDDNYARLGENQQYYTINSNFKPIAFDDHENIDHSGSKKKVYYHHYEDEDQESFIQESIEDFDSSPRSVVYQPSKKILYKK